MNMTKEILIQELKEKYNTEDIILIRERLMINGHIITSGLLLNERFFKLYNVIETEDFMIAILDRHFEIYGESKGEYYGI